MIDIVIIARHCSIDIPEDMPLLWPFSETG